jgi:hypothetical protein
MLENKVPQRDNPDVGRRSVTWNSPGGNLTISDLGTIPRPDSCLYAGQLYVHPSINGSTNICKLSMAL